MSGVGFLILFGLNCLLFPCKGAITSPPDGTEYVFLPGKTVKIKWEFDDAISSVRFRDLSFNDGSRTESLASISRNDSTDIETRLFEVDIERPATLVLKNVNQSYNGMYRFGLMATKAFTSDVTVFIAKKPHVTLDCPSRITVNESNDFTCVCRGKDGNPPANVTWYKDGNKFGEAKKENNTLTLSNVNEADSANYMCEARSHTGDEFVDEKSIEVFEKPNVTLSCPSLITVNEGDNFTCGCRGEGGNPPANVTWYKDDKQIGGRGKEEQTLTLSYVSRTDSGIYTCIARSRFNELVVEKSVEVRFNYKPNMPVITFTPEKAVVGIPVVITCESEGVPKPSYTIVNNDTVVSTCKTYAISKVKWSDGGTYKCTVMNKLGRDTSSAKLIVEEAKGPCPSTTFSPTTQFQEIRTTTEGNKTDKTFSNDSCTSRRTEWYIVVVSLVSGIIIGIFLSYIVSCSRRKFGSRKPQSQRTEDDRTYQELDLSKMNREDNYQSLRGINAARSDAATNDDDSTYTELNIIRDVENSYQSLT